LQKRTHIIAQGRFQRIEQPEGVWPNLGGEMRRIHGLTQLWFVAVYCLWASPVLAVDLALRCDGVQRHLGTAYERDIEFELEFDWTSGSVRMFDYKDNVRNFKWEGQASEDNNVIYWGGYKIDRHTGGMVRYYRANSNGENVVILETMRCQPIGRGTLL
jgi:hypothetical protein